MRSPASVVARPALAAAAAACMATWIVATACAAARGMGSGDLFVGERSASGGMGGEGRGASHGDRGNRTRRLDGLPGAVLGRIGALEDGQYALGTVGSEVNGLNLGQRANLHSHLAVKQRAGRCR